MSFCYKMAHAFDSHALPPLISSTYNEGLFDGGLFIWRCAQNVTVSVVEELALRLKTQKTAISRIENHTEDIKLSTLDRVAKALGKRLEVNIA